MLQDLIIIQINLSVANKYHVRNMVGQGSQALSLHNSNFKRGILFQVATGMRTLRELRGYDQNSILLYT